MIIGIDLGTNNTVLSYYKNGHLHLLCNAIPSIVCVEDNNIKIGEDALVLNHHKNLKRKLTNNPKIVFLYQAFLTKIKEIIEIHIKEEYQVIVTVPAYFSETDKDITKRAIISSGLPLLRLLPEPTAAGIAYGYFHHTTEEVILVFDMGAGTTDLTLMRKSSETNENFYEVISIMGDVKFGGEDITNVLSYEYNIKDAEKKKILLSDNNIDELSQKNILKY
jgi:molecular chaperone DnaK (HSP70)